MMILKWEETFEQAKKKYELFLLKEERSKQRRELQQKVEQALETLFTKKRDKIYIYLRYRVVKK